MFNGCHGHIAGTDECQLCGNEELPEVLKDLCHTDKATCYARHKPKGRLANRKIL